MKTEAHSPNQKPEKKKEQRICVEYKGGELILQPGHKVFQINLKTGIVSEHKLYRKFTLFFWKKPVYKIDYHKDYIHIPAYDIHKARITFKHLLRADKDLKVR